MKFPYEEFGFNEVRTYPLKSRHSKSRLDDFARPFQRGTGISGFVDGLPKLLAGKDFRQVVDALVCAHAEDAGIVWGIGAHVIKTGLSPTVIDLMERGFVSAVATNG
ncbi:MAG: hypothetical protein VYA90_05770, partial [Acidobacteriota bacterium]|nr:hypothetical protein [Acidobacteriota bacterium]